MSRMLAVVPDPFFHVAKDEKKLGKMQERIISKSGLIFQK